MQMKNESLESTCFGCLYPVGLHNSIRKVKRSKSPIMSEVEISNLSGSLVFVFRKVLLAQKKKKE